MNKLNRKNIITLIIILLLLVITTGISFAFFSYVKEGSTENSVKLGSITFIYTENQDLGNGIMITDAFPISDAEGKALIESGKFFDFKVESNLSRSDLEYEVVAEPTDNSTLPLEAIKFYLTDITDGTEKEIESTLRSDNSVKTLNEFNNTQIENAKGKTIYQETILKNTKGYLKKFRVRMWIDEDIDWSDDKYINKSGAIRINVYANSNRDMASTEPTNPEDTSVMRVTANNKYLFTEATTEDYQYTVTVPNEIETLDIDVIPNNTEATVSLTELSGLSFLGSKTDYKVTFLGNEIEKGSKLFQLKVGENYFKAVVTSSSGVKRQEFILKVVREKSGNTNLENLAVVGYELSPLYSDLENLYELEVPYETTNIEIVGIKKEEVQTVLGLGTYDLNIGTNVINVKVKAENGTERTIQITVNRKKSDDASISNVRVVGYSLTHVENNIYSITVPYAVESITIENVSTTGANVTGVGEKTNLVIGNNDYEVTVTSGSGLLSNEYIIRIVREKDTDNTLKSLSLTDCTLTPTFDKEVLAYSCIVENSVTSTTVSAEATSSVATITGLGEKGLVVGDTVIDVVVIAQDGSNRTYKITVTRLPNTDASLKSLGVEGQIITPTFSKDTLVYSLSVPYNIDTIKIIGESTQSVSSVEGLGSKVLEVGENSFNIIVTAEDKTTIRTYNITVTREQDTDTSLKDIGVTGYDIVKVDDNNYTLTVENNVTSVEITAASISSVAVVTGTGNKILNVGSNPFEVTVTAQNGAITTYNIIITRKASSDATLKNLTISSGTLSPEFESGTTSYTVTVPYSVASITVNASVNNSEASLTGDGTKSLNFGSNTVSVVVTAGDGTEKTYTITITREQDTDATLKSLSLTSCTLNPEFASETTSYTCTVENNITKTVASAETTSSVAVVSGIGEKSLTVGSNTINVVVTAQDGITTKTYTVTVNRKASSDATLKELTISGGNLSPTFASEITSYTLTVPYNVTSITVTGVVNNSEATYTVSGNTGFIVGDNTVSIKVTAGDGTEKTYTIIVTRSKDTDATLKSLSITGYSLSPAFASETTSYTLTLEASSVEVTASATSSVATVSGTGTQTLNWGSNTVSVIVTAQDGTIKTYVITITNQRPTAPTITGGSDSWVATAPTISVSTAGTAISGVKHYEYYKSTSNTTPTDSTTATGTTSGSLTVSDEGTYYTWYRTVSNNGFKSVWTGSQVTNLDTVKPTAPTLYVKANNTILGSVESSKIDNIYTNNVASVINASTDDINVDHYNYTQYKFDNQIDSEAIITYTYSSSRILYNVNSVNVNDTLYFDYIINTNSPIISADFNDTGIVTNVISLGNNTYRILGSHTVTKYDVIGTSEGRPYDFDQMRFIDINYQNSSTRSILNEFTYLNPTITKNTFDNNLSVVGNNTLYKIEAVDKAGNISESTYVLVNNTNSDSYAINNIVTISKDYYYRKLGTSATLQLPNDNSTIGLNNNTLSGTIYIKTDGRVAFQGINSNKCEVKRFDFGNVEILNNTNNICSKNIYKNLVINGYGEYGDNTNFENFTYNSSDNAFSLDVSSGYNGTYTSILMPINSNKKYNMQMDLSASETINTNLAGFFEADVDKKRVDADTNMYIDNTLTSLAKDLNNGDTVVYLTDLSNWNVTSSTPYYQRGFRFWNYKNSNGYQYPPLTYSRNYYFSLYDYTNVDKTNNTITLNSPWTGGYIQKGTQLSQSSSGSTFKYAIKAGYSSINTSFETAKAQNYITGIEYNNSSFYAFNYATKYIGIFTEFNYNNPKTYPIYVYMKNIIVEEVD